MPWKSSAPRLKSRLQRALWELVDARNCLICGGPLQPPLLERCLRGDWRSGPAELRTGNEQRLASLLCPSCRQTLPLHPAGLQRLPRSGAPLLAVFAYQEPLRSALIRLKFQDDLRQAEWLAIYACHALARQDLHPRAIVPVPLSPARRRQRGYNQSEVLARAMGAELGIAVWPELLQRSRDTVPQTSLNGRLARLHNLRGAFRYQPADSSQQPRSPLLLLDDICTSGATLDEAALALTAGGQPFFCLALAREALCRTGQEVL